MECKVCHKQWHYCSSCQRDFHYDHGVCSEHCLRQLPAFQAAYSSLKVLFSRLDLSQSHLLAWLIEESEFDLEVILQRLRAEEALERDIKWDRCCPHPKGR
jgi:hypothetical protein